MYTATAAFRFSRSLSCSSLLSKNVLRLNSTSAKVAQDASTSWESRPWRISAAVSVERIPRLTPPLNPIEEKVKKCLDEIETERSAKSDHEVRHEEDKKVDEMKARGETVSIERLSVARAYDDEEKWKKDADKFQAASRITDADKANDKRSIDRSLDRSLFLVVNHRDSWTLPMAYNEDGESLRETAERALKHNFGQDFQAQVLGNAPFSHFKMKYSKKIQEKTGARGEQVFIYKAFFKEGSKLDLNKETCKDFHWLKRDELSELVESVTRKPLMKIIYDED